MTSRRDTDLSATCSYANSKGEVWTNTVTDILSTSLCIRPIIAGRLRSDFAEAEAFPPITDYIHAVRQRLAGVAADVCWFWRCISV